jgi:hypothetical protein
VFDSFVRKSLGITEVCDLPEAYARVAREVFEVARNVTDANPAWMGSLEPCSPLRAYGKCLWWFGGGNTAMAAEVQNPWRIVDELGLARP